MNSISYLTHRADSVLRPRKPGSGKSEVEEEKRVNIDLALNDQDADAFSAIDDEEGEIEVDQINDEKINERKPAYHWPLAIMMFIPNMLIVKPILFIWFIITFPLSLLERQTTLPSNLTDEGPELEKSDEDEVKEPYDEAIEQQQLNIPASTSTYQSTKLGNPTIFESDEEEVHDEAPIDPKSPTSPASALLLSPSTKPTSKDLKSSSATSRSTAPRSYLTFPKTVFPMSLINSRHKKTLILDLDETLIHSISRGTRISVGSGHMVEVRFQNQVPTLYYIYKRPYCDLFLKQVSKWFNLVIFTASVKEYADPVVDWLESERKYFKERFYRDNCTLRKGQGYIKDLATVDKNLNNLIIIDNSPISYAMHENNAIVVEGWINDPSDADLLNLIPLLSSLRYTTDVRAVLSLKNGEGAFEK